MLKYPHFTQMFWLALLVCCCFVGCDTDVVKPPKFVEIKGKIYLDGVIVSNAKVFFVPALPKRRENFYISFGESNSHGEFSLRTRDGTEGAIAGTHKVLISRTKKDPLLANIKPLGNSTETTIEMEEINDANSAWAAIEKTMSLKKEEDIPFYYNVRTELTCDVVPGTGINHIKFELSSTDPMLTRVDDSVKTAN